MSNHQSPEKAKAANTDHPIHELLSKRWSPRAFADRAVQGEDLKSLMESAW